MYHDIATVFIYSDKNKDKQASDDEDNEIEIVEPKTDLITLDSDDEEPATSTPNKTQHPFDFSTPQQHNIKTNSGMTPKSIAQANRSDTANSLDSVGFRTPHADENIDLMSMAQSFLASMLEVEIHEPINSPGSDTSSQKKQPRKKLTNKPNPTLLKQKAIMERERLEEMKRNDQKLKMKCSVELKKAEEEFPYAKEMLQARSREVSETEASDEKELNHELETSNGTDVMHKETTKNVIEAESIESSVKEITETDGNNSSEANSERKATEETGLEEREAILEKSKENVEEKDSEASSERKATQETALEDTEEALQRSKEGVEQRESAMEATEKEIPTDVTIENADKSVKISTNATAETVDKSAEDIVDKEEGKPQDDIKEDAEQKSNNTDTMSSTQNLKNKEDVISTNLEEDSGNNGINNGDSIAEKMEIDDSPSHAVNSIAMEIDERKSPQGSETKALEREPLEIASNDLELKADPEMDTELESQNLNNEIIANEDPKSSEQKTENIENKNEYECMETINEDEVNSTLDIEHPRTLEKANTEIPPDDLPPIGEEEDQQEMDCASKIEDSSSNTEALQVSSTVAKEVTPSSSNGNV